jgi:hypothetical protein
MLKEKSDATKLPLPASGSRGLRRSVAFMVTLPVTSYNCEWGIGIYLMLIESELSSSLLRGTQYSLKGSIVNRGTAFLDSCRKSGCRTADLHNREVLSMM